jgi:ribulose-phosphate 3-epimerase
MTRLSVSVLSADLARLAEDLEILRDTDSWAHVDVMDGQFCPAFTVGPPFVAAVASTGAIVDAHLMVEEPRRFIVEVAEAGAGIITVHAESTRHLHRTMTELTDLRADHPGLTRGVALNPATPIAVLDGVLDLVDLVLVLAVNPGWRGERPTAATPRRVAAVRELAGANGHHVEIGVDGGVTLDNAAEIAGWGADVVVSGSAIYDGKDPAGNLARIRAALSARPTSSDDHRR